MATIAELDARGIPIDWALLAVGFEAAELTREDVCAYAAEYAARASPDELPAVTALAMFARGDYDDAVAHALAALASRTYLPAARRLWTWFLLVKFLERMERLAPRVSERPGDDLHVQDCVEMLQDFWDDVLSRFWVAMDQEPRRVPHPECEPTRAGLAGLLAAHRAWADDEARRLGLIPAVVRGPYR